MRCCSLFRCLLTLWRSYCPFASFWSLYIVGCPPDEAIYELPSKKAVATMKVMPDCPSALQRPLMFFGTLLAVFSLSPGAFASSHSDTTLASLPLTAQSRISASLGRDDLQYGVQSEHGVLQAKNPAQQITSQFGNKGVKFCVDGACWQLSLLSYGYGSTVQAVQGISPTRANSNRVEYRRGMLTEWYVNGPAGLEQGFTLAQTPGKTCGQPLSIALAISGAFETVIHQKQSELQLRGRRGGSVIRYGGLSATDATGRELPAWMELHASHLVLKVEDAGAHYPVVVDPLIRKAELTASYGTTTDGFGYAVAISGDTIVVGAPTAQVRKNVWNGAAYVFVKPVGGWANMTQTAKLWSTDRNVGSFGSSVAISGRTIAVGVDVNPNLPPTQTIAYVFKEPAGGWANKTQTARLNGSELSIGPVSLSMTNTTVVAGVYGLGAFVFEKPKTGWQDMSQTAFLYADTGGIHKVGVGFGSSTAISGDTVVIGANGCCVEGLSYKGSAFIFVRPTGGWQTTSTYNALLQGTDVTKDDEFGQSVGISGGTVVVGNPFSSNQAGAAYVFVEPTGGWTSMTQTARLSASDGGGWLGAAVAIEGDTIAVGSPLNGTGQPGAVYMYHEPKNGWKSTSKFNTKLTGTRGFYFGQAVSMSGGTVVAGFVDTQPSGADVFSSP